MTKKILPPASSASLDLKIGQMLLIGFRGLHPDETLPVVRDLREEQVGGIILFDYDVVLKEKNRNVKSPDQLAGLNRWLHDLSPWPLLLSIDQEGGLVNRLKPEFGFPATRSHKTLGSLDPDESKQEGFLIGSTLREYGINLNFSPTLDVNINPDNPIIGKRERSFSSDPETVARLAEAYIRGHHNAGVLTCVKHFPGHGSSQADTHLGMVDVTETWTEAELIPYRHIISKGICDMVMSCHVFNRHLDPEFPGTLSSTIMDGILRMDMGFDGVVISDDMQMRAISHHYGLEQAVVTAVNSGIDMLAYGNNLDFDPDIVVSVKRILKNAIDDGSLTIDRINQAYERIRKIKQHITS